MVNVMPKYEYDKRRGTRSARGYDSRWAKAAKGYLLKHPWCDTCQRIGLRTLATQVDHDPPHGGDMFKFWDQLTWSPKCASCHSVKTRSEMTGATIKMKGTDERGWPLDREHPWRAD